MSMQDAANIASSWLEWGSSYQLPEPPYVTISRHDGMYAISYQFGTPGDVQDWARCLMVDAESHAKDDTLFTSATYNTGGYEIKCYSVTPFTQPSPREVHEAEMAAQWRDVAAGDAHLTATDPN